MMQEFWYDSQGAGRIHGCRWTPEGQPRAILQIVHGIAEYAARYDEFARYLCSHGILVVAEDHMGHGGSVEDGGTLGYFHGGWFAAVEDTYRLLTDTRREYPDVPYILFGHSMGSFIARTILCRHPNSGIAGAFICGTCWQPPAALPAIVKIMEGACKLIGEKTASEKLQGLVFGGYNGKVEHPRTPYDWLSRDKNVVDAYVADPLCGFTVTAGLLRDMMQGISYIEKPASLAAMKKDLPVYFIAGGDDPVGSYGKGIKAAVEAFRKAGMTDVSMKLYPLGRHEILNEINREAVFDDVLQWVESRFL